ncbi:MAG: FAD-dependent oxidoreductase [Leptospiraceae bacterium]|nr:FAD-dependent oxidoreductase [Leptospiraceae bacterium]
MTKENKSLRIAVIGAGASGLTISHYLQKNGYSDITVFERNADAGGKVFSLQEEKTKTMLEFGAVWVPFAYTTVRSLIDEFNVELIDAPNTQLSLLNPAITNQKYIRCMLSTINKYPNVKKYLQTTREKFSQTFAKPGFNFEIDEDLTLSFSEYLKKFDIEPLGAMFNPLDIGCGYGFPEEVPALYKLKFFDLVFRDVEMQLNIENRDKDRQTKYVKKGYQEIWKQVASRQNIRFNYTLNHLRHWTDEQGEDKIGLTFNNDQTELIFDRVFISSTGDAINQVLDTKSMKDEREVFKYVQTYPYYVTLFKAENLNPEKLGVSLISENATNKKPGHPTILAAPCPHLDGNLFMSWSVSNYDLSDKEVENRLASDIEKLGGTYKEKLIEKKWSNYFPHVKKDALMDIDGKGKFYSVLNELQGKKGIYYAGGLLSFETVEHAASYGKYLIESKFR